MTNTDCLDGLRCPSCGADNAVHIEPSIPDDHAIDEECRCASCGHTGIIGEFDVEQQKAEALHAAAPELLAALEAAQEIISGLMLERDEDENDVPSIVGIRAAIAKAKGS